MVCKIKKPFQTTELYFIQSTIMIEKKINKIFEKNNGGSFQCQSVVMYTCKLKISF